MDQVVHQPHRKYWHPDLHFGIHEYVRYYRIQLKSRYSSKEVFASFKALCEFWKVGTYTILEVYGSHDLIVRMYSKQSRAFNEAFIKWLKSPVKGIDIRMEGEPDDYDTCLYHWLWTDRSGKYQNLSHQVIERIKQSPHDMMVRLSNPKEEPDFSLAKEVLRVQLMPAPGIRFIVMITGGDKGKLDSDSREALARDVLGKVLEVKGVKCLETYRGTMEGWLIFDGRVDYEDYISINHLKNIISETRMNLFGCRATTYLCCDNIQGVDEVEELYVAQGSDGKLSDQEIIDKLKQPESEVFETKGSLRMNMDEFFKSGTQKPMQIDRDKPDPILKTIAAFANGGGGTIIVGALEEQSMAKKGIDVTSLPEYGEYRLCGIDMDFLQEGFDKAQRHLMNLVRKNMDTGTAQLVEVRRLQVKDRELMAIIVQKSGDLKPYLANFYVRNGAQTDAMTPVELKEFLRKRQ